MRAIAILAAAFIAASSANADRFVMKDNSVLVGKLTGMQGSALLVTVQGRVYTIPIANVSLLVFDDGTAQAPQGRIGQPGATPPQTVAPPTIRSSAYPAAAINPISPVNPVAPIVAAFSQTAQGFRFDLDRCIKQNSKSVVCSFRVTNQGTDKEVGISANGQQSYYVDDRGMQRGAESVQLGTRQGNAAETLSVTDVPVQGSITFPGVESGVNSLAKLTIFFHKPQFTVEFRKVPLQGN